MSAALTIAGSDSGGGAGIQADLRAFGFFGVFGTSAITAVTAQNPERVSAVEAIAPAMVTAQIRAVFEVFDIGAVKTGMLFDAPIIECVSAELEKRKPLLKLVIDPVMIATSGARLLCEDAVNSLISRLLPMATLITPNLPEAAVLLGEAIETLNNPAAAAAELSRRFACAVLVKGGHSAQAGTDFLAHSGRAWELKTPVVTNAATHGTGCSLSAAAAACLAGGDSLLTAVCRAKAYVYASLLMPVQLGSGLRGMWPPAQMISLEIVDCQEL